MDKPQPKSKKEKIKFQVTDKPNKRTYLVGSIIATFIAVTPYLFYLYEHVPTTQVWDNFLFTYDSKSWEDANFAIWVFVNKAIPLILLFIWFLTCRHWWYHVLLVPIVMYIYQVFGIFNDNIPYFDQSELMYFVPIMAIVIPSIYLIRAQIFNKINNIDKTMKEIEEEFTIKPSTFWGKVKQYF